MKRRSESSTVLFDVFYLDGTRSSNRKVLTSIVDGLGGEEAAQATIAAQDREIGLASGRPRPEIKSIVRKRA
jgi:hypothetical protein